MTTCITPTCAPVHASAPYVSPIKAAGKAPESELIDLYGAYIDTLEVALGRLMDDQGSRNAAMADLSTAAAALRQIDADAQDDIASDEFDRQVAVDTRSPAGAGKRGGTPVNSMTLRQLMASYGICKEGKAMPFTHEQLKALIDKVESRSSAISTTSGIKTIELNKLIASREQAFTMTSSLLRQLIDVLQAIIKQMG